MCESELSSWNNFFQSCRGQGWTPDLQTRRLVLNRLLRGGLTKCLFDQGFSLLHAHMEPHAVITYCPFRFYSFSDANLDTNLIFQRVTFRLAIAINTVVFSKIGRILTCTLSFWITSQNGTKCLILKICFNWGIQEQWIMTTAFFFKKMTQINFVSGNQLHITLNSCQHLNFGLSWPG